MNSTVLRITKNSDFLRISMLLICQWVSLRFLTCLFLSICHFLLSHYWHAGYYPEFYILYSNSWSFIILACTWFSMFCVVELWWLPRSVQCLSICMSVIVSLFQCACIILLQAFVFSSMLVITTLSCCVRIWISGVCCIIQPSSLYAWLFSIPS